MIVADTKAVILAAGAGKRLGLPIPKSIALVGHRTILHRQIDAFRETGIEQFVIVVGFEQELLRQHLQNEPGQYTFVVNDRFADSNTIYSLYLARAHITGSFFCANADVLLDHRVIERLQADNAPAAMAVRGGACSEEDVKVQIQDHRVVRIGKTLEQACCNGEFMGIARFDRETARQFLGAIADLVEQQHVTNDYFERAVDQFCAACTISAVDVTDLPCIEVDFPEDLETARRDVLPQLA